MRNTRVYALSVVLYAAVGWLIETIAHFIQGFPLIRGILHPLPLKPTYGFGALLAILIHPRMQKWPLAAEWLALSIILAAYEVLVGIMSRGIYARPLWHYNDSFLNVLGYTDAFHAGSWGLLTVILVRYIHPKIKAGMEKRGRS